VKYCCGAETDGIIISSDEQTVIYNEVVVACLEMISLSGFGISMKEGSKCMRKLF
jgi:hypothetical protein